MLTLLVIRTHSLHQGVLCPAWYLLCILADVTIYPPSQNPWRGFPVQICFIQRYLPFSQPLASFIIFFYLFQSIGFFFCIQPFSFDSSMSSVFPAHFLVMLHYIGTPQCIYPVSLWRTSYPSIEWHLKEAFVTCMFREMAQSAKRLPFKCEDLSSFPRTCG